METRVTTTDLGRKIAYDFLGAGGKGEPVVLIASTGRGGGDFHHLARELAALGHSCIAPHPRGISGTDGPLDRISFDDLACDVAHVIRASGGPVIVAGHAYGNWIARTLAANEPDLVKGVVLLAAASGDWPRSLTQAINTLLGDTASREERLAALRHAFFAEGNDPKAWLTGWHKDVADAQRQARHLSDRKHWWGGGSAPILDLIAESDPFRPPRSRSDFRAEFGSRVTTWLIEGASHALPDERPREVARAIHEWSRSL